jgi:hypothetical protein
LFPTILHRICAVYLAVNYFAFQIEVFEEEYEANHRQVSEDCSIASPTLNWETFDKENAPKAFTVQPMLPVQVLLVLPTWPKPQPPPLVQSSPIRDKSPPSA